MALPQQARVLVRRARRPTGARLPPPRQLGRGDRRRRLPAGLGAQQRGAQPGPRLGAARGDSRLRPARAARGCCEISSSARAGAPASFRPGWSPPGRASPGRPSICTPSSRAPAAAPTGRPACSARSSSRRRWRGCDCESRPRPSSRPTPRWPSACTRSPPTTPGSPDASGSSTSTAESARSASRSPRRQARFGESRRFSEAVGDAEENARRNGIANARFIAADVRLGARPLIERAGRPDVVVLDPPRAGLSKKVIRRVIECGAPANRLRLLQPDDAGPERLAAHRRRLYAPAREAGRHVSADPAHRVRGPAGEVSQARGFGVAAGLDPEVATPLAERCEALGYSSVWSNDHPGRQRARHAGGVRRGLRATRSGRGGDGARSPPAGRDQRAGSSASASTAGASGSGSAPASPSDR